MNKKIKFLISQVLTIAILITVVSSSVVFAKTDSLLMQDINGKYFKYNLKLLNDDAVNKAMELPAPLYDEYKTRKLVAFHDDKTGYVDQNIVNDAAVSAAMAGVRFDLDEFTESTTGASIIIKPLLVQNRELIDGTVTNGTVETGTVTGTVTVSSVNTISITKAIGDTYILPVVVTATLSDGTNKDLTVTWDKVASTKVAGTYKFTGNLTMVDEVVNTNNITVAATLTITASSTVEDTVAPVITRFPFGTVTSDTINLVGSEDGTFTVPITPLTIAFEDINDTTTNTFMSLSNNKGEFMIGHLSPQAVMGILAIYGFTPGAVIPSEKLYSYDGYQIAIEDVAGNSRTYIMKTK